MSSTYIIQSSKKDTKINKTDPNRVISTKKIKNVLHNNTSYTITKGTMLESKKTGLTSSSSS
ncbi:MAG TPA: hypothetical protein VLG50_05020 [Candidatus Saccharimonadales bacterium]|nr:hypothetical protein [Candidatus Saccharimonadales bacterium]